MSHVESVWITSILFFVIYSQVGNRQGVGIVGACKKCPNLIKRGFGIVGEWTESKLTPVLHKTQLCSNIKTMCFARYHAKW